MTRLLGDVGPSELRRALKHQQLYLDLGPFRTRLGMVEPNAITFFQKQYANCPVVVGGEHVADHTLRLRAPNRVRRYLKPQIMPDPGFAFPTVPLPARLSPLTLEMGLNLCVALQCFRFLIFHAGVVAKGDNAIVITARSGGGKSTLTAALMEQGYRLLSDEFAILNLESARLQPYPRPVSLKNESIDVVKALTDEGAVSATLTGTPKGKIAYRRARHNDLEAMQTTARPRLVVIPKFQTGALPTTKPLDTADAAMQLIASSPNYQVIGEQGFQTLMTMLDGIQAFEMTYGSTEDSLRLIAELEAAL